MRASALQSDPGYKNFRPGTRVYLEGVEVTHVITADEELRFIVQADLDEHGRVRLNETRTDFCTVTRHGHVRIELPDPPKTAAITGPRMGHRSDDGQATPCRKAQSRC